MPLLAQTRQSVSSTWLELPDVSNKAGAEYCLTHYAMMNGTMQRNYTFLYDVDTYVSYWVIAETRAAKPTAKMLSKIKSSKKADALFSTLAFCKSQIMCTFLCFSYFLR